MSAPDWADATSAGITARIAALDPDGVYAAFLVRGDDWEDERAEAAAAAARNAPFRPLAMSSSFVAGGALLLFAPLTGSAARPARVRALADELLRIAQADAADPPWVGMTAPKRGAGAIERAVTRSIEAVFVARATGRPAGVVAFEDVVVDHMLLRDPVLRETFLDILDPVVEYRAPRGDALVETLRAFFAEGLEVGAAGKRLGLHRHTVRYRLALAERLLNRSVRMLPDRLTIEIAVAAHDLEARAPDAASRR